MNPDWRLKRCVNCGETADEHPNKYCDAYVQFEPAAAKCVSIERVDKVVRAFFNFDKYGDQTADAIVAKLGGAE